MANQTAGGNKDSGFSESNVEKEVAGKHELGLTDNDNDFGVAKNAFPEQSTPSDDGSMKTVVSADQKSKITGASMTNAKGTRIVARKSPSMQTYTLKNLANEVREMRERIRKLEFEVSTLHELLKVQDDITAETLAILPNTFKPNTFKSNTFKQNTFKDTNKANWKKQSNVPPALDYRLKADHHKYDRPKELMNTNNPVSQAMMMSNYAWYGDAFLYELLCQFKGYHPKDDTWFTSVYSFVAFETFCNRMFNRKNFFRACVICIGYSDLFNAKPVTGYPLKQTLHALLNYMNEHGATHIKVLSIPPARQMMKNVEYLKICQTTNKFLKAITKTHDFVEFVNLDKFFINNADDFFNYIDGDNEVQVQIRDHLLMRKINDHFEIFLDPNTAKTVVEHIIEPNSSSKGYQTNNSNGLYGNKRRADDASSPTFPAKRMNKLRPFENDEDYEKPFHRAGHSDRRYNDYNDYEHGGSQTDNEFKHNYDYRPQRSNSKSERNSPPPWLKK